MFQNWCVGVVSCKRWLWRPFMWMRLRWNRCKTIVNPFYARSSCSQTFFKIGVLKNCKFHRKTPTLEFLFRRPAILLKGTLTHGFSTEICEIFQPFFTEYLQLLLLSCHLSLLRPLKTSENQKAFGYFQGV